MEKFIVCMLVIVTILSVLIGFGAGYSGNSIGGSAGLISANLSLFILGWFRK